MTPKDLASSSMQNVVDENLATYREPFSSAPISEATHPYWRRTGEFFAALDAQQKAGGTTQTRTFLWNSLRSGSHEC